MSSLTTIYDFETPIQVAFIALMESNGLTAIGPDSPMTLQDERPRVEVMFTESGARDTRRQNCPDGVFRHDLYTGTLTIAVVTNPRTQDEAQNTTHATYRAAVRQAMSGAYSAALDDFVIKSVIPTGATPKISADEGFEVSNLTFSIEFCIKPESWPT